VLSYVYNFDSATVDKDTQPLKPGVTTPAAWNWLVAANH
jgi:hypothetical protein